MYNTIQLSEVLFLTHVNSMTAAKTSLSSAPKLSVSTSSESRALALYQEQFKALEDLVTSYISLLETDIGLISDTGQELVRTDRVLGQSILSGLN